MPLAARGVGINGISVYIPRRAVDQTELEEFDNVPTGKYTVGLGQRRMSVVGDREDSASMCMTAVDMLTRDYGFSLADVGRLEVATESNSDRSKSLKSVLMQLFESSGNFDVEGLDSSNACYGSTQALFNTVAWMESSAWDGRHGVIVAGDVACYPQGPARPTGGAGAVALLITPCAALRLEPRLRATHMQNTYDFYKPVAAGSTYPQFNGRATLDCYFSGFEKCLTLYSNKFKAQTGAPFALDCIAHFAAHMPYSRLGPKLMARMRYREWVREPSLLPNLNCPNDQQQHASQLPLAMEKEVVRLTKELYQEKCGAHSWFGMETGNSYTASLYSSIAALIESQGDSLVGSRVLLYSFGSGYAASLYSLRFASSVASWPSKLRIQKRLGLRETVGPEKLSDLLADRENKFLKTSFVPQEKLTTLWPGTYYLSSVAGLGVRHYSKVQ